MVATSADGARDIAQISATYMKRFVGYEAVRAHGMVGAITNNLVAMIMPPHDIVFREELRLSLKQDLDPQAVSEPGEFDFDDDGYWQWI
ncbi:hypothetical protein L1987_21631 [Smallanthus sonchifolius]|uniref:Uncharacterized protein n=1 Tax=Smallanthus sonchifolius TaxID=185202 RepID=A0ACB9ID84_9ASTR|nr:hypothetical protein L1987_21631 [Smallanthus sonchifolius]